MYFLIKRIFPILLTLILLLIPYQEVFSYSDNINNEKIKQWLNQINPDIETYNITSLNKDYELIYYLIKNKYYGYLVINKDNEIIEYGEGLNVPYSTDVIINTNNQKYKMIDIVYFSPIENYWELNIYNNKVFIEGYSGEWLLDLTDFKGVNNINSLNLNDKIEDTYINSKLIFDPYENLLWLFKKNKQSIVTETELKEMLRSNEKILFSGKKYNNQADFAYSIIGYQSFDNKLYIATYDPRLNIIRYISYDNLICFGSFSLYKDLEKDKFKLSRFF